MSASAGKNLVVLVDDDEGVREAFTEVLESEGYDVLSFNDGREALAGLRERIGPCLILLDWMMPGMNGEQFLKARDGALREIPVVVLSAVARRLDRVMEGVAELAEKPIDIESLVNLVRRNRKIA